MRLTSGTAELYVAILGTLYAGAAYVPVDAEDPEDRVRTVLQAAGVCALITDGLQIEWRARPAGRIGEPGPQDDAWIIFTSGSTGAPKGVAVTHRSAAAFVAAEARLWDVSTEDRVLAGLSVAFDASCEELWLAWANGATLVPAPRALVKSGLELGPWLAERAVTVISTVPTLAALWDENDLSGIRLMILGGEACPEALAWRLAEDRELWNTYGPTEATVVSTARRLRVGEPVTIGSPLAGWLTAVVGPDDQPVAAGEPGELVIAGAGLGRYLDPDLDRERFRPLPALGWARAYRTGDIVRETRDGLAFIGRRDHQVKVGGRRVELGEIDAALNAVPTVRAACTVVRRTEAGNERLVGYVASEAPASEIRAALASRLPADLLPVIVVRDALPVTISGKVDRKALPWPPDEVRRPGPATEPLTETEAWLAERWAEQLGPLAIGRDDDFFALGGSSLAAAKLASRLRERFPAIAVADIYHHRGLTGLAARLEAIAAPESDREAGVSAGHPRWAAVQLAGLALLFVLSVPQWVLGILAENRLYPGNPGPQVGWGWLAVVWLALCSAPARALIAVAARRLLLPDLREGRYPRRSWLACRLWFVERVGEICRLDSLAGTPWAARYARLTGHQVGPEARLGTLPPATSLVTIGAGATIEGEVDLHGWWIDGSELVVGSLAIGADARIGTRALLMPGARIGAGAEIEPGAVIEANVPPGERWAGVPGRRVGTAGEAWPDQPPAPEVGLRPRLWRAMFGVGLLASSLLTVLAFVPAIVAAAWLAPSHWSLSTALTAALTGPLLVAVTFVITYALLVALVVRLIAPLIREGWQPEYGAGGWALWMTGYLMGNARGILFPLYATVFTRPWLRLAGIEIGPRAELSTVVGLNRTTRFAARSFCADDVVLAGARARGGWLHVAPITIGEGAFLGNGALVTGGTEIGHKSLIGVLTTAPARVPDGTSWLGAPALELPRRPMCTDASLTVDPPPRLIAGRTAVEVVRVLHPTAISALLAGLIFASLDAVGSRSGLGVMVAAGSAGHGARRRPGHRHHDRDQVDRHRSLPQRRAPPLVGVRLARRDHQHRAGAAGRRLVAGAGPRHPVMRLYLRLMGARVGRDAWVETLTITEFDLAELGDGAVANRNSVIETHLFQDRVMQIGPATLRSGATLGPAAAMLPETDIGAGTSVGGRSIVMRGERLPPGTRWHGAPVVAAGRRP